MVVLHERPRRDGARTAPDSPGSRRRSASTQKAGVQAPVSLARAADRRYSPDAAEPSVSRVTTRYHADSLEGRWSIGRWTCGRNQAPGVRRGRGEPKRVGG